MSTFGALFKKYRLKAEFASLSSFADALAEQGLRLGHQRLRLSFMRICQVILERGHWDRGFLQEVRV